MFENVYLSSYLLRIHIGPDGELVFYKNVLLCLRSFSLVANGETIETLYGPATSDLMRATQPPANVASNAAYPLRMYVEVATPTQIRTVFHGRPIGGLTKVELELAVDRKAQVRLYHREPLPPELQEALLDAKVELHQEYDDARV